MTQADQGEIYYLLTKTFQIGPFLILRKRNFTTQDNKVGVEFDYKKVYDREDSRHDVMGFYHTHPKGCRYASEEDNITMKGWAKCLGKPLICIIRHDTDVDNEDDYSLYFYDNFTGAKINLTIDRGHLDYGISESEKYIIVFATRSILKLLTKKRWEAINARFIRA